MDDILEDIPDDPHKAFMARYLKDWPYPHLTQFKAGQMLNVQLNGVYQRSEVQAVDCSVMQVLFQVSTIHKAAFFLTIVINRHIFFLFL